MVDGLAESMVGWNHLPPQVIQRETRRALVLNLLWQNTEGEVCP